MQQLNLVQTLAVSGGNVEGKDAAIYTGMGIGAVYGFYATVTNDFGLGIVIAAPSLILGSTIICGIVATRTYNYFNPAATPATDTGAPVTAA